MRERILYGCDDLEPCSLLRRILLRGLTIRRARAEQFTHCLAVGAEPAVEDRHVAADVEVTDAHLQVALGLLRLADLGPRLDAGRQRRLDDIFLSLADARVVELAGNADAHRVVAGT